MKIGSATKGGSRKIFFHGTKEGGGLDPPPPKKIKKKSVPGNLSNMVIVLQKLTIIGLGIMNPVAI